MELKKIAIVGPRGNVGSAIISELLKDGSRFTITAITRSASTYAAPENSHVQAVNADYNSLKSLIAAFQGQDAVVNCVSGGATQYDPSKLIIDAAVAAGVKLFFGNEYVGKFSEQFKRLPESAVGSKVRIREYLSELGQAGKISWTALNGGPFFDMCPAGFDIPNKQVRIYGTGTNPLYWTPLSTIARTAATMLRNPTPFLNRPIYICPLLGLTQSDLLRAVESVLGAKFAVEHVDVAKINENARIALDRGEIPKAMRGLTISGQFYEGDCGNDFSDLVTNELVGVSPVSVEDAVRDAIERYGTETPVVQGMFKVDPCEV
ncbi:isoflavone reductase family protein [Polyplosphaeria fusca]|uniref:Isoflavone reductase family protein n=1 Tax=Polyplosphaeria fusca TaxID=682080 RepID=A0A9P4QYY7_9PLEO|nr:isoflavone reductase family protein [Polyplosphaeria fusca]